MYAQAFPLFLEKNVWYYANDKRQHHITVLKWVDIVSCSSNHDPSVLATVTGQTSVDPTLMQLMLIFDSCCLVSIIKNSVHPTPNITDTVSHGLDDKICIRRSIRAKWYIQLCTVRVTVDLWEVAFNDLKQFSRVDIEKQGAQTWTLKNTLF